MSGNLLRQIRDEGVSPWLDGVTRDQLRSGALRALVDDLGVSGVTTNPTLFAKSLSGGAAAYESSLRDLAARGVGSDEAARLLSAQDAREACDIALPGTVSTMPLATLTAAAQAPSHLLGGGPANTGTTDEIRTLRALDEVQDELMPRLLADGVGQFQSSWQVVLTIVAERLADARDALSHPRS